MFLFSVILHISFAFLPSKSFAQFLWKKDENNNGQRIIVQQSQVIAHTTPASNGDSLLGQESKPEPMSGIKQTTDIISPKMEPLTYYPSPIAAPPHAIKEIEPAVSICHMILILYYYNFKFAI